MVMFIVVVHGWAYCKIGSFYSKSPSQIESSTALKLMRLSIINKSYAFCNKLVCPHFNQNYTATNSRFEDLTPTDVPEEVYVSIDKSCNLRCKSCRNHFFNAKGYDLRIAKKLGKILVNSKWTSQTKRLIIASQGEIFFSQIYKKMLFDSKLTKRDDLEILTNGTLMTKTNLDKLTKLYPNLQVFVTIDAATEETYKKIRIGGNFNKLMENLEYLSTLRKNNIVKKVVLLFVVQKDNYKEIIDVLKLYNWDTDPVPAIVKGGGIGERFLSVMHKDKKNLNDSVRLVVPKGIGEIVIEEADDKDILAVLK